MLQNAYLLAKFRADTAENEQHFAEILRKIEHLKRRRRFSGAAGAGCERVRGGGGPAPAPQVRP